MERVISAGYLWHNYGKSTIGSKEDIERVKAPQLRKFYEKYYQPDNATLIIAGKFDEKKALEYIIDKGKQCPFVKVLIIITYSALSELFSFFRFNLYHLLNDFSKSIGVINR